MAAGYVIIYDLSNTLFWTDDKEAKRQNVCLFETPNLLRICNLNGIGVNHYFLDHILKDLVCFCCNILPFCYI